MKNFDSKITQIQSSLGNEQIDGWLLFDFHHSNPIAHKILDISPQKMTSRRFFYWIPAHGECIKIVPYIEPYTLDHLPGQKKLYKGWEDLNSLLFQLGGQNKKIAMEYSPFNSLPSISKVDAGIVELIRQNGSEVVSSALILQLYTSIWTDKQLEMHRFAAHVLEQVVDETWRFIRDSLLSKTEINEYQVQQFIIKAILERDCETADLPICAVNVHSADPHYSPQAKNSSAIQSGNLILLDLWCKQKAPSAVYADITRMGVAAKQPSKIQNEVFEVVKRARDAATQFVKTRFERSERIQGWEVDQICRNVIREAGYGEFFIHRTGHHLGEDVHGPGANLDNLETHDVRELLPGTGFTIEPGIYLPQKFGIRLEYDLYLDFSKQVHISGGIQETLHCLL